jgi:hypothetical protein
MLRNEAPLTTRFAVAGGAPRSRRSFGPKLRTRMKAAFSVEEHAARAAHETAPGDQRPGLADRDTRARRAS